MVEVGIFGRMLDMTCCVHAHLQKILVLRSGPLNTTTFYSHILVFIISLHGQLISHHSQKPLVAGFAETVCM